MEDLVQCPICYDPFLSPLVICENNHHLCEKCYLQLPTSTRSDGKQHATCPLCHEWCFPDAQPNRLLNEVVERYLADHPREDGDAPGPSQAGQAIARRSPRRMRASARELRRARRENEELQQLNTRSDDRIRQLQDKYKRECEELQQRNTHRLAMLMELQQRCAQSEERNTRSDDRIRQLEGQYKRARELWTTRGVRADEMERDLGQMRDRQAIDDLELLLLATTFCVFLYRNNADLLQLVLLRVSSMLLGAAFRLLTQHLCGNVTGYVLPDEVKLVFCFIYVGMWWL